MNPLVININSIKKFQFRIITITQKQRNNKNKYKKPKIPHQALLLGSTIYICIKQFTNYRKEVWRKGITKNVFRHLPHYSNLVKTGDN